MTLGLLGWLGLVPAGSAHAETLTVRLCVDIVTTFTDADYLQHVAGDWWTTNEARPARGVRVAVTDGNGSFTQFLGPDGCGDLVVTRNSPAAFTFTTTVNSEALVNGVHITARDGRSVDFSLFKDQFLDVPGYPVTERLRGDRPGSIHRER